MQDCATEDNNDKKFEDSISHWTLRFKNPARESEYEELCVTNFHFSFLCRLIAYLGVVYHLCYRFYAIYLIKTGSSEPDVGTMREEVISVCIMTAVAIIECILKFSRRFSYLHGFVLYVVTPVSCVNTAFYSHKEPFISIMYSTSRIRMISSSLGLMMSPFSAAALLNSWRLLCLANLIVSGLVFYIYMHYFGSSEPYSNAVAHIRFP